jgi:hypothetical protein
MQVLWYYLWIAPHVLLVVVFLVMVLRGLHRQFPMFFLYTISETFQFGLLFFAYLHHDRSSNFGIEYTRFYSIGFLLSTVVRFGVIYEVLSHLLSSYPRLKSSSRWLLRAVTSALLLVAIGVAISIRGVSALLLLGKVAAAIVSTGHADYPLLLSAEQVVDQTVSILQCGLLVFLFLFSRYFTLSWRSPVFGIALGVGIFASVRLVLSAIRLRVGNSGHLSLTLLDMGTYHLCVLIWLFYMLAPERPPKYNSKNLPEHDLDTWNQELRRLIQK